MDRDISDGGGRKKSDTLGGIKGGENGVRLPFVWRGEKGGSIFSRKPPEPGGPQMNEFRGLGVNTGSKIGRSGAGLSAMKGGKGGRPSTDREKGERGFSQCQQRQGQGEPGPGGGGTRNN